MKPQNKVPFCVMILYASPVQQYNKEVDSFGIWRAYVRIAVAKHLIAVRLDQLRPGVSFSPVPAARRSTEPCLLRLAYERVQSRYEHHRE